MKPRLLGKILLVYFFTVDLLIIWGWADLFKGMSKDGWDGDSEFFMLIYAAISIYFGAFTFWTARLMKREVFSRSVTIQFLLLFLFGVCLSLYVGYGLFFFSDELV